MPGPQLKPVVAFSVPLGSYRTFLLYEALQDLRLFWCSDG